MRIKLLTITGFLTIIVLVLFSSFSIQSNSDEILLCNHWLYSENQICKPLWNSLDQKQNNFDDLSEEDWRYLLSLSREDARMKLEQKYAEKQQFFMNLDIMGLNDVYEIGDDVSFTVVEAGYGIPCTHPKVIVSKDDTEKHHWEYHFVHSCPFFKDGHPILSYMKVPLNNIMMTPITEPGVYTIDASSSYNSSTSKKFTVLESDFIYDYTISYTKNGNNTGLISLQINMNNGNYILDKNSKLIQDKLTSETLQELKQLVDDNDLLRGLSSVSHDRDISCKTCINYEMKISLGDYTHFVQWQNDKDRLREKHIPVIEILEEISTTISDEMNY